MKSVVAFVFFALISFEAHAGQFDGVWTTSARPGEYFMVRSFLSTIVVVRLSETYEIFVGPLQGQNGHISTYRGPVAFKADINFLSSREATLKIQDCSPVDQCDFFPGTVLSFKKYF